MQMSASEVHTLYYAAWQQAEVERKALKEQEERQKKAEREMRRNSRGDNSKQLSQRERFRQSHGLDLTPMQGEALMDELEG